MEKEKIKDVLLMIERELLTWKARRELAYLSFMALESFEKAHTEGFLGTMREEARRQYADCKKRVIALECEYNGLKKELEGANG